MIDRVSRGLFHILADSQPLKRLASRYGMKPGGFARRFIAGENVDEAIETARSIEAGGMTQTLDYLGESVATMAEADQATRVYLGILDRIAEAGIGRNVSLRISAIIILSS